MILLLVFITGILITVFCYYLAQPEQKKETTLEDTAQNSPNQTNEDWIEYRNEEARLKFSYPQTWTHTPEEAQYFDDAELGEVSGKLKSPTGKIMGWHYTVWGGKGGDCEPNPGDKTFTAGNKCSSKRIYNAEIIELSRQPESKLLDGERKGLVLTQTKYQASGSNGPSYQVCLDDYYLSDTATVVGEFMGLVFACEYWTTGFNAKFEVENKDDLTSEETKVAIEIMKTFKPY